ncbi:MAG TPA: hypothetical protein VF985_09420, partial [Mariniflexile sp.]
MKKYISIFYTLLTCCVLSSTLLHTQLNHDWEDPEIISINKEKPHAFLLNNKINNQNVVSLNGIWKFKWSQDPQSRPKTFYESN